MRCRPRPSCGSGSMPCPDSGSRDWRGVGRHGGPSRAADHPLDLQEGRRLAPIFATQGTVMPALLLLPPTSRAIGSRIRRNGQSLTPKSSVDKYRCQAAFWVVFRPRKVFFCCSSIQCDNRKYNPSLPTCISCLNSTSCLSCLVEAASSGAHGHRHGIRSLPGYSACDNTRHNSIFTILVSAE